MLKLHDVSKSMMGRRVLEHLTFSVAESRLAGLIGPSGSGKSVLLKVIGRVAPQDGGTVEHGCNDAAEVSLMFQEGALFDSLTVFDNIAFPLVNGKVPSALLPLDRREEVRERVAEILGRVGLRRAAFKYPAQLSGGMRRRVSLARALVSRPRIILLDDPTSGLDPVASSVIMDLIVELHREYRPTTVIASHDLRRLLPMVEEVIALFDGRVVFQGSVSELAQHASTEVKTFVSCRYDFKNIPAPQQSAP